MNTHDIDRLIDKIEAAAPMDIAGRSKYIHDLRAAIEADSKQSLKGGKALQAYKECDGDKESDPIERLRFYCSLAMSGQDWLDAEQFFDSLIADRKRIASVVESSWREGWSACRDAEYSGSEAEDFSYGASRANYIALRLEQGEPCETSGEADRKRHDRDLAICEEALQVEIEHSKRLQKELDDAKTERKQTAELLRNPVHVHTNMCRGIIAPITFDMLAHVLGDEATNEWIRKRSGEPVANTHTDDDAVDHFAAAMKEKLAQARAKGRSGWQECDPKYLSAMLREHVEKGDPRDVANFCMFLWSLDQPISADQQPTEPIGAYQLHNDGSGAQKEIQATQESEPVAAPAQSDGFSAQQCRVEESIQAGTKLTKHRIKLDAPQPAEPVDKSENMQGYQVDKSKKVQSQEPSPVNDKTPLGKAMEGINYYFASLGEAESVKPCDCERGHNGMGLTGRECDCPAEPVRVPSKLSNTEILSIAYDVGVQSGPDNDATLVRFARTLLSRYGAK